MIKEFEKIELFIIHILIYFFYAENLEKIKNYEELLSDIINTSHQMFENKGYLTPAEKHILVKVMGFCIFLIDSEQVNVNKLDQKRLVSTHSTRLI